MGYLVKTCSFLRMGLISAVACLALISCGGGGGGGGETAATTDAPVVVTTPALDGTWRLYTISEGFEFNTGLVFAGKDLPTAETVSQLTMANLMTIMVPTLEVPSTGYSVTVNGNTVVVTGSGTNFTVTINSFSVSDFQSCGACGGGSTVQFKLNANVTEGGTIDGEQFPTETINDTTTIKWVRVG